MDNYVENYNNVQYGKLFGQLFGNRIFRKVWGSANSLPQFSEVSSFLVLIGYSRSSVFACFKATLETNEVGLLVWSHHLACPAQSFSLAKEKNHSLIYCRVALILFNPTLQYWKSDRRKVNLHIFHHCSSKIWIHICHGNLRWKILQGATPVVRCFLNHCNAIEQYILQCEAPQLWVGF